MKKTLIFVTTVLSLVLIASAFAKKPQENIRVEFNKKTTQADLDRIQKNLQAKNIELVYEKTEFDTKGRLLYINFKVKSTTRDIGGRAQSPKLTNNSKFGFLYDFKKASGYDFIAGDLRNH